MNAVLQAVFLGAILTVLPAFLAALHAERRLAERLRTAYPAVWADIAPDPLMESGLSSSFARFIVQRRYRALGDPDITRLGDRARRRLHAAVGIFLVLVLSGVACGSTGGPA